MIYNNHHKTPHPNLSLTEKKIKKNEKHQETTNLQLKHWKLVHFIS